MRKNSGLSLIELSIGLTILGLLLVPALHLVKIERERQLYSRTTSNITGGVQAALQQYALNNGRYPRPAWRNRGPGHNGGGKEVGPSLYPWCRQNDERVCVRKGLRDTDSDNDTIDDLVMIGSVPYASLGLPYSMSIDAYGNQYTYAVSWHLTDKNTFDDANGVIQILNRNGEDISESAAHYVVFSHGANGKGAYSLQGVLVASCDKDNDVGADLINCDKSKSTDTASFTNNFDELNSGSGDIQQRMAMMAEGADYYDDFMYYTTSTTQEIWTRKAQESDKMFSRNIKNIRVGLLDDFNDINDLPAPYNTYYDPGGGDLPLPTDIHPLAKIDVLGDVRAEKASLLRLCNNAEEPLLDIDGNSNNRPTCPLAPTGNEINDTTIGLTPAVLAGKARDNSNNPVGILCDEGRPLTGIYDANEECNRIKLPGALRAYLGRCPNGYWASGVSSSMQMLSRGRLICVNRDGEGRNYSSGSGGNAGGGAGGNAGGLGGGG